MDVRQVQGYGVENDPDKLLASVNNGVNVIQMDLEKGLVGLEDGFFDHVIMTCRCRPCTTRWAFSPRCCAWAARPW